MENKPVSANKYAMPRVDPTSPTLLGAINLIIRAGDDNPDRPGMVETPKRYAKALLEYTKGYRMDPVAVLKTFEDGAANYDEMVCQTGVPVYSLCEHHLAPFFGVAHVAYIPEGRVVGLSKVSRLVDVFAHRFQVQERLTQQIAECLRDNLSQSVAVVLQCRHMCMEMRGIQRQGCVTTTSSMQGVFRVDGKARSEFFQLIRHAQTN